MRVHESTAHGLDGIFAVPPLPRSPGIDRSIDFEQAERLAAHIEAGGISRYLYGGNAFVYHITIAEYETLLAWLSGFPPTRWAIPGIGPSYGRAMDQARLLRRHAFRAAMALPCSDPRDAAGLEAGLREIATAAGLPLVLYIKADDTFGADMHAGLEAIGRLVDDGIAIAIKYAIVRTHPESDPYLTGLLARVPKDRVISGMGERPALVHARVFGLRGLTTGSGCIQPAACSAFWSTCQRGDWTLAAEIRAQFLPLEDLRDAWGPARVLHHAMELAGLARTGPIPPFVSSLSAEQLAVLSPVTRALLEQPV